MPALLFCEGEKMTSSDKNETATVGYCISEHPVQEF